MKKFLICMFFALTCLGTVVFAAEDVNVYINGDRLVSDVSSYIENGRTLVPIRAVSEYLKYDVSWDEDLQMAEIKNADDVMKIYIGKTEYNFNGETRILDVPARLDGGRTMVPIRIVAESFGCEVDWDPDANSALITKYNVVEIATAQEFVDNMRDNTKLILVNDLYNLSDVEHSSNEKASKIPVFDGEEWTFNNLNNIAIESKEGVNAEIVIEPRYAEVLNFFDCQNVKVKGITAGHTVEQGYCTGGVIQFLRTTNAMVENCKLYGCGTYGVTITMSISVEVKDTEIYDCTYGGLDMYDSFDVTVNNCVFRDIDGFGVFTIASCCAVEISDCVIKNVDVADGWGLVNITKSEGVKILDCKFSDNSYQSFFNSAPTEVEFVNCSVE